MDDEELRASIMLALHPKRQSRTHYRSIAEQIRQKTAEAIMLLIKRERATAYENGQADYKNDVTHIERALKGE